MLRSSRNQLVSVTPVTLAAGASAVSFAYDHLGRRTSKTSAAWNTATGSYEAPVTHRYAYQGFRVIYETVGDGPGKTYVWGTDLSGSPDGAGGVGGLLWMNTTTATGGTTTGTAYAYAYDGNGNVRGIVRVDDGTPSASTFAEKYAYDGFGRELASGTHMAGAVNTVRFSTKMLDPETGLNYYGLRYYASDYGRWINRDPILERGGKNLYRMAGNGLIIKIDLIGLSDEQFYIVGTVVAAKSNAPVGEKISRNIARALGLDHVDLYFGKNNAAALLRQGFPAPSNGNEDFPSYNNDVSSKILSTLTRVNDDSNSLKWGKFSGTKCSCVTDAMRINSIQAAPAPRAAEYDWLHNNCQQDLEYVSKGSCLSGYTALGLPVEPYWYMNDKERAEWWKKQEILNGGLPPIGM